MEEEVVKPATVYLLTHRTHDLSRIISMSGYLFNVNDVAPKDRGKHWALIVHFDDEEEVFVCELERFDVTLTVYPKCEKMSLEEVKNTRHTRRIYKMGRTSLSEKVLYDYVQNNEINSEKYHLLSRNCQHWAQLLTKDLNLPYLFQLDEEQSTPEEPVYKYELQAGNHLGLESKESKCLNAVKKCQSIIDEVMDKVNKDETLTDEEKVCLKKYVETSTEEEFVKNDVVSHEQVYKKVIEYVNKESKDNLVVNRCMNYALKLQKIAQDYTQNSNNKNDDNTDSAVTPTKSLTSSFASLLLNK